MSGKKFVESTWTGSSPDVTHRLYLVIVLSITLAGAFGLFLLVDKSSEISTYGLAKASEALYKRSTKISKKYIQNNDAEIIQARILEMFHCNTLECGTIQKIGLHGLVRKCVNYELGKLLDTVTNATKYLESLR